MITSSDRLNMMVEWAFSSRVVYSLSSSVAFFVLSGSHKPCCFSRDRILICHKPKLFLPVNLSTFTFRADISIYQTKPSQRNSKPQFENQGSRYQFVMTNRAIVNRETKERKQTQNLRGSPTLCWLRPRARTKNKLQYDCGFQIQIGSQITELCALLPYIQAHIRQTGPRKYNPIPIRKPNPIQIQGILTNLHLDLNSPLQTHHHNTRRTNFFILASDFPSTGN